MQKTILVIEDKPSQLRFAELSLNCKFIYHSIGGAVSESDIKKALLTLRVQADLVLVDITNYGALVHKIVRELHSTRYHWPIVVIAPYGSDDLALQAVGLGACDYISKPVTAERLNLTIRNMLKLQNMTQTIARLERNRQGLITLADMIAHSSPMTQLMSAAQRAVITDIPVWVDGEDGTGKEFLAHALHGSRLGAGRPFVIVECSQFADAPLQGGQNTDSGQIIAAKLREAQHGTLYLRDVNLLPQAAQQRLWDILENTGNSNGQGAPEVRFISSCGIPVDDMMRDGNFTSLHKKLHGVVLTMPPLRLRKDDIPLLAQHFVGMYAAQENKYISDIAADAMATLVTAQWPGNVVQLSRLLHRAVLLCNHHELDAGTLRLVQQLEPVNFTSAGGQFIAAAPTLVDIQGRLKKLKSIEEEAIRFALMNAGGSMTRAARNLGIGRSTLYRKVSGMQDFQMPRENQTTRPTMLTSSADRS